MRTHIVCKIHAFAVLVGPGTPLEELECPKCIEIADAEYAAARRPCCSRANIDCCGHGPDEDDAIFYLEISSPDYCDPALASCKHTFQDPPF